MLAKPITFKTFDDEPREVTRTFYFHLSFPELLEYVASEEDNLNEKLRLLTKATSMREVITTLKELILMAYGVRSEDGEEFDKSDEIRAKFYRHAAYSALYMELCTNENAAAEFIKGILPKDMGGDIEKAFAIAKEQLEAQRAQSGEVQPTPSFS